MNRWILTVEAVYGGTIRFYVEAEKRPDVTEIWGELNGDVEHITSHHWEKLDKPEEIQGGTIWQIRN